MNKAFDIAQGWARYYTSELGLLPDDIQAESKRRLAICDACPFRVKNKCSKQKEGRNVITDKLVTGCGCNIKAKSMADRGNCPAGKW